MHIHNYMKKIKFLEIYFFNLMKSIELFYFSRIMEHCANNTILILIH